MSLDETDELDCLNVTVLRRWLGEREQEAVEMFIRLNWLTAGQSLEELGDEKTCRCLSEFDKIIGALDREVERKRQVERDQQAAKVRAEFNLRKIIEARRTQARAVQIRTRLLGNRRCETGIVSDWEAAHREDRSRMGTLEAVHIEW